LRQTYYAKHFGRSEELVASADALGELARVYFLGDDLSGARARLDEALRKAPQSIPTRNNLGVVLAGMDSLDAAEDQWRTAIALGAADPGVWLNLGLARWVQGDSLMAQELLARGIAGAGGYEGACHRMGLPATDSLDRASSAPLTEAETRVLLRAALRRVPAKAIADTSTTPRFTRRPLKVPRSRIAATRSAQEMGLHHYLCWIE
jgi:hypothetical protein